MAEHTKEQDPHSHCSPRFSFRGTFPGGGMAFTLQGEEKIHSCKEFAQMQLGVNSWAGSLP